MVRTVGGGSVSDYSPLLDRRSHTPPATMFLEVLDYGLHAGSLALYEFGVSGTCSVPSGFIM
jgi:hypothetical protein